MERKNTLMLFMVTTIFSTGLTIPIESVFAVEGEGTLYATEPFRCELWTIDPSNGDSSLIGLTFDGDTPVILPSLAVDPTSGIMYAGGGGGGGQERACEDEEGEFLDVEDRPDLYIVDPDTGDLTLVGATNEGNLVGLDFRSDGILFAAVKVPGDGPGGNSLGTVDTSTGDTTIIGSFGFDRINSIAFFGGVLYGVSYNDELYTIDTDNGEATVIDDESNIPLGASQFACDGTYYVGSQSDEFGTLDITNGVFTQLASQVLNEVIGGFAFIDTCTVVVGGTYIPIDQSALLLAGVQSVSMWMIPVVIAGIGIGVFVIKRKK